jgi:hypothetical protein
MLKYGMPDLRAFFEADVRWLSYYGFRPLDFPTLAGGLSGDIYSAARAQTGSKMTQTGSVMARHKLTEIIEHALRDALGAKVLDRVEVTEGIDHDGEAALFVTVHYRSGTDTVDQTAALSSVRDRLRTAGENRFPYMNHVYPDDPLTDDEADDVRSAS